MPGEIAAVDIFADFAFPIDKENLGRLPDLLVFCLGRRPAEHFASQLVLIQKFAHGLLGTGPNHATRARNCKKGRERHFFFAFSNCSKMSFLNFRRGNSLFSVISGKPRMKSRCKSSLAGVSFPPPIRFNSLNSSILDPVKY